MTPDNPKPSSIHSAFLQMSDLQEIQKFKSRPDVIESLRRIREFAEDSKAAVHIPSLIMNQGFITLNEPTAGAGAMILAAADALERQGFDPAFHMLVKAQDISQLCFHMCFLQLTFKGIPALVERANTLSMKVFEQAWTPHAFRFYQKHGRFFPCAD